MKLTEGRLWSPGDTEAPEMVVFQEWGDGERTLKRGGMAHYPRMWLLRAWLRSRVQPLTITLMWMPPGSGTHWRPGGLCLGV